MKLKTLKEIEKEHDSYMAVETKDVFYDLRQEAIKRAKYFKGCRDTTGLVNYTLRAYWDGRYQECMDYNNLTEKDLEDLN